MTSQLFRFTRLTFGFAGLFFLFACASSGTAVYQSGPRFPAKSQVEELAQKPAPEIKLTKDIKTVELWELQGDLPDTLGFRPIKTKPDATQNFVLAIVGNAKEVTFTEGMACVARQHAKFTLAQKSQSDDQLANFISARCGTTGYAIRRSHVAGDINPAESDGDILKRWSDLISTYVSGFAGGGPKVLGVHLERSEKSAVLSVAYAAYNLRLDDTSAFVDAKNRFVLKGQSMDANIKRLSAYLNWGASESRECVVNEAVKLPLFEILCEASPGDKTILIEVASFKNDVLLGRNALRTLVRRADEPARVYRQHILPEMTDEDFPEEAAPEFLIRLNRVRKEAGLSQLRYEAVQSDLASRLAPHYFAVGMGLLPELWSEQIALGLLAGWDVEGLVESAGITSVTMSGTQDVALLLAEALQSPSARSILLSKDADSLALGLLSGETFGGLGALVSTYSVFKPLGYKEKMSRTWNAFAKARAAKGLGKPRSSPHLTSSLIQAVREVEREGKSADDVFQSVLQKMGETYPGTEFWITYIETDDLNKIPFPDKLLERSVDAVGFGVALVRPPGQAWGRYIVFMAKSRYLGGQM